MQLKPAGLWRHPDFMKLWVGQTISEFGSRITRDGLPIMAVLVLGATPWQMALLAATASAPIFIVGLFVGVWVDRLQRRPIMIFADLGRAILLGSIPVAALLGLLQIEQLYLVAGLVGVFTVFFDVSYQTYLPSLVQKNNLVEGNSKLAMSSSVAEIGGPALTGGLVQILTAPVAILLDAFSFLVSAASLLLIKTKEPALTPVSDNRGMWRDLGEGIRTIVRAPVLRALVGSSGTFHFFAGFVGALYYYYVVRDLEVSPGVLGFLIAGGGAGALLGSMLTGRFLRLMGLGRTILITPILTGALYLLIPLAGGTVLVSAVFLGLAQFFGDLTWTVYEINILSLRQSITPGNLLGRVNAGVGFVEAGLGTLGLLVGGFMGEIIGPRPVLFVAAVGFSLASVWVFFSPVRSLRTQPVGSEESNQTV